jgi:hypothetical protein
MRWPVDKLVAEIKYFIHDLRVDKFFIQLIEIHSALATAYEAHEMGEAKDRHLDYINRLQRRRDKAHAAGTAYEIAVKSRSSPDEVVQSGRVYIDATLEACRIALLPHWRTFDTFLVGLPNDTPLRQLETEFHEVKRWIAAIDRRIVKFIRDLDEEPPMEALPVSDVIRRYADTTLSAYVRTASDHRLDVRLGHLDRGRIWAERSRWKRLIFNIVMNAVDAMRDRQQGVIKLEVHATDLVVTVTVSDQGVGMTAEKIDQILHSDSDLTGELHSLGFRFLRESVNTFNGKIYVESTPGEGTRVRLAFPRYAEDAEQTAQPTQPWSTAADQETAPLSASGTDGHRAGASIVDDFCHSLAPLPGCIFSITVTPEAKVEHFTHKPYDREWAIGHEDLAPMFYRAVFRGRYETDDRYGSALVLKGPHSAEDYFEFKDIAEAERKPEVGKRLIHNEFVLIARVLIQTGLDPATMAYITSREQYFTPLGQSFSGDPFPIRELAEQSLVE